MITFCYLLYLCNCFCTFQDEWVISRVFQKSSGATAAANSAKKTRFSCTMSTSSTLNHSYPEPSSPSSVSLPPLLDHPAGATAATAANDNCSYDSHAPSEHVSCFSTIAAAAASATASTFNPAFDFTPPHSMINAADPASRFGKNVGFSAFPNLRSLQENLQLPLFLSPTAVAPPFQGGSNWSMMMQEIGGGAAGGGVGGGSGSRMAVGPTELDCMWTY